MVSKAKIFIHKYFDIFEFFVQEFILIYFYLMHVILKMIPNGTYSPVLYDM